MDRPDPSPLPAAKMGNTELAGLLEEVADRLQQQEANPFRVRAYQQAAQVLRDLPRPVRVILNNQGLEGLKALPGIGESLARAIRQVLLTGRLEILERLRGEADPESLLASVPGIGQELARRIHEELGIETLPELEAAAWDGRLARVTGMGPRRLRAVRESLETRLSRSRRVGRPAAAAPPTRALTPVADLLDVDREYREKAQAGRLRKIAPRRFNPQGQAWLPILHTSRGDRQYTAVYSNTRLAHKLNKVYDWVVIYRDDLVGDGQWTVVTAHQGPHKGKRIVRGREEECQRYYDELLHAQTAKEE